MMNVLISIIPGVSIAVGFFLLVLSGIQLKIYLKKGYQRSRSLSLFCFFSAVFALEHFVVQSRLFSPWFSHLYVLLSTASLCASLFFYISSLSYFVAIPGWVFRPYRWLAAVLSFVALASVPAFLFFNIYFGFDPNQMGFTGNYFVDSYATRLGQPVLVISSILSVSGAVTVLGAAVILRNVLRSSQDTYLVVGLLFSIFAAVIENFLLPFTFSYFVPVIFLSNLFEAFRMNSLSYREFRKEKERVKQSAVNVETKKYQNSNLTEQRIQELAEKITQVLGEQRLFENPNLNSEDLARKIGIPGYQLSQVVNIGLNTTFFELLSSYRIDDVKAKLLDEARREETIIDIAYSSGFNSKSTFNTAFKKQTGVTPSQYRKKAESRAEHDG